MPEGHQIFVFPPDAPELVKEKSNYLHQMHITWNQVMILGNASTALKFHK
jgi:hypothetical protein